MKTTGSTKALAYTLLLVLLSAGLPVASGTLHAQEASGNFMGSRDVPLKLRDGTATLDEARTWVIGDARQQGWDQIPQGSENPDLDLDGKPDLLLETAGGGSAGRNYAAFLATASGYRYIGGFLGRIAPVSAAAGAPPRMVIAARAGGGCSVVQLVHLTPDGMHSITRTSLRTGDSGTDNGNRLYQALFGSQVASEAVVREVFGRPSALEALAADLPARIPDLQPSDEFYELCGAIAASYDVGTAKPPGISRIWINMRTYDSPEEAQRDFNARGTQSTAMPMHEEILSGHTVQVWTKDSGIRICAVAGRHVLSSDGPEVLIEKMKGILEVLQRELGNEPVGVAPAYQCAECGR